jgi:hypothetical protein
MTDPTSVQDRLNADPAYRSAFFCDPAATLRAAGVAVSAEKEEALAAFARQALAAAALDPMTKLRSTRAPPAELRPRLGADL